MQVVQSNSFSRQSGSVYAVSEDEMIQYHQVFADSGNAGAQVQCPESTLLAPLVLLPLFTLADDDWHVLHARVRRCAEKLSGLLPDACWKSC